MSTLADRFRALPMSARRVNATAWEIIVKGTLGEWAYGRLIRDRWGYRFTDNGGKVHNLRSTALPPALVEIRALFVEHYAP